MTKKYPSIINKFFNFKTAYNHKLQDIKYLLNLSNKKKNNQLDKI